MHKIFLTLKFPDLRYITCTVYVVICVYIHVHVDNHAHKELDECVLQHIVCPVHYANNPDANTVIY